MINLCDSSIITKLATIKTNNAMDKDFISNDINDMRSHRPWIEDEYIDSMPATGVINGHEYVDLGLSVKWAICNVGADSSSDYGDYYAWGEIATKLEYTDGNRITCDKGMKSIAGDSLYDVARAKWGDMWRLPTLKEVEELCMQCSHVWTMRGGHWGYKVTGPNGNSIFLPAAGYWRNKKVVRAGEFGNYWTSDFDKESVYFANFLSLNGDKSYGKGFAKFFISPGYGQSVRPVIE